MKLERKRSRWKRTSLEDSEDNTASDGALSYSPDCGGLLGKAKGCKMRRSIDCTKSRGLDEAHLELDINRNLNGTSPAKNSTIEEEGDRIDGLSRNSFKNHKKTFHKHFPEIAELEELTSAFTCAIQKEVLYHGRMYISEHHVCFHSSVLLKETKVVIPASTIQVIKKKNTARVVPNAISIITNNTEKHLFVSIRNRDVCFKLLQLICPHLQTGSANGSPQMSSVENVHELEIDTISSHSSQEDNGDHRRVSLPERDKIPLSSFSVSDIPNGQAKNGSTSQSEPSRTEGHSTEEIQKDTETVSWVTMVTEKIRSAVSTRTTSQLNKLLTVYLLLVLLLLLTSGYIGLRIVALEEQLNTLGSLPEFSLQTE
uniref:GRAM domain-containing protein n=1 Tax=Astyanax mexicanus TaxID=7994 RepID=A0A3B1JCQ0_ASTMX